MLWHANVDMEWYDLIATLFRINLYLQMMTYGRRPARAAEKWSELVSAVSILEFFFIRVPPLRAFLLRLNLLWNQGVWGSQELKRHFTETSKHYTDLKTLRRDFWESQRLENTSQKLLSTAPTWKTSQRCLETIKDLKMLRKNSQTLKSIS